MLRHQTVEYRQDDERHYTTDAPVLNNILGSLFGFYGSVLLMYRAYGYVRTSAGDDDLPYSVASVGFRARFCGV
uniref:WGS project CBMI000000000 data, contig CS3069_c005026 n=1 Tax=Fusarium clavum TaxID=2594811 RepID=A0A090N663_9HYPO|nr:unnamed protein product [Fusarium clavum]